MKFVDVPSFHCPLCGIALEMELKPGIHASSMLLITPGQRLPPYAEMKVKHPVGDCEESGKQATVKNVVQDLQEDLEEDQAKELGAPNAVPRPS